MERKRVEDFMLPLSEYPNLQRDKSLRDAQQACREYRNMGYLEENSTLAYSGKKPLKILTRSG